MEFLSLSRRRSSPRNVPSDEERGETDVFAGYQKRLYSYNVCIRRPSLITALYLIDDLHDSYFTILGKSKKEHDNLIYCFLLDQ